MVTPFPAEPDAIVGGVAGVARYLAPALAASGEVELHVIAPGAARAHRREADGYSIRYLPATSGPGFLRYWTREARQIGVALDALAPDLVHVQAVGGWARHCRHPWLLTLHGIGERDVLYSNEPLRRLRAAVIARVEAAARRRAPHVISISPYLGDVLGAQLRGPVSHIENPVDDAFFEVARHEVPGRVAFVGRIGPRKNLFGLLEALETVVESVPEAELVVAGDDETPAYAEACRSRVAGSPALRERVRFVGSLAIDGVRDLLAQASCLVLPSFQETAPLVIEEAMAAGVPVLGARVCGIPHLVEDGGSGYLFDPRRPDDLAAKLLGVLGDGELRQQMSRRGRVLAESRFRATAVARRTLDVYRDLAGSAGGRM